MYVRASYEIRDEDDGKQMECLCTRKSNSNKVIKNFLME